MPFLQKKRHIGRACLSKKRSLKKGTFNKDKQTSGQPEIKKSSEQSQVQNLEVETANDSNSCYNLLSVQDQLCSKYLIIPALKIRENWYTGVFEDADHKSGVDSGHG
ncbi:hypothetical protein NQ318_020407 [Aromia moschata]|uniref:Uncharacterized protein n=1 Tax=Aromia moschata TaxID=1265417 RepID=A0AAV8Y2D3_9CUCU|nr:hypothetical protein NQ318_020407 [Aromia moschata]